MAPEETSRPWRSATYAASIGLMAASASMAQTSSATAYSGQAYVVQATVPPLAPIRVAHTGSLPSTDNGETGRGVDRFQLQLNGVPVASDFLPGGNIQLRKPECR
jgi:hypothetical protein